jgi:hypothetical protein
MRLPFAERGVRPLLLASVVLTLSFAGCGLDKVEEPPLIGPSETGISVQLTALPDTLNADGVSVAVVQLVLRNQDGRPVSGRAVLFEHDGDGLLAPSAASTFVGPIQTGIVMATDNDGVAYVVYVAGTARRMVTVWVRPYGIDAANLFYRSVEVWQR